MKESAGHSAKQTRKTAAKKSAAKTSAAKKPAAKKSPAPKSAATAAKKAPARRPATKSAVPRKATGKAASGKVVLLSGGNPQIAKGDGDDVVQSYIKAMPGWKRDIGRRLDGIINRVVPGVAKAVKWNSPFYGVNDGTWFLCYHCFTNYVKVTFFRGTSLHPVPGGKSKHPEVRYLDVYEDQLDEKQFADWVKQASKLPGEKV